MSTTIHLSDDLLAAVDRRAKDLRLTRNRYIVQVLERSLRSDTAWSPAFVEELRAAGQDQELQRTLAEIRAAINANRTSKGPPAPSRTFSREHRLPGHEGRHG